MTDRNSQAEEQTKLFETADSLLSGLTTLTRIHRSTLKLAVEEDTPMKADIKWKELHRLHKLNKQTFQNINRRLPVLVDWFKANPTHTVFMRFVNRLNQMVQSNHLADSGKSELTLQDLSSEKAFGRPYRSLSETNNSSIKLLYRRLYAAEIDSRNSAVHLVKNTLNHAFTGQPSEDQSDDLIAKNNMMYVHAVDMLERHMDVLGHRQSLEQCGQFDMTVSLTENISNLMDSMTSRNRLPQETISKYSVAYGDYLAKKKQQAAQELMASKKLSKRQSKIGTFRNSSKFVQKQSFMLSAAHRSSKQRQSSHISFRKSHISIVDSALQRNCLARNSQIRNALQKQNHTSFKQSRFQCLYEARSSSTTTNSVGSRFSGCGTVKEDTEADDQEPTRLETCLSIVGMGENGGIPHISTVPRSTVLSQKLCKRKNTRQQRTPWGQDTFMLSSHHFKFKEHSNLQAVKKPPIHQSAFRFSRFGGCKIAASPSTSLFIGLKERINLHNLNLTKTHLLSYDDFTFTHQL